MLYEQQQLPGGGGAPAIDIDTISCGGKAGGGGAPTINNNTINRREWTVEGSNNDTIGNGEQAGGGGTPAINNDTISRGGEAGGGGAPAINNTNTTVNRGEQAVDGSNNDTITRRTSFFVSRVSAFGAKE